MPAARGTYPLDRRLEPGVFRTRKGKAMKVKGHRPSVVRWMLAGLAAVLVIGGPARDASAANVCNAALDSMFVSGPNFVVPGDATRDTVRLQLTLGAGTITGAPVPPGPQLTLHRLRFDLDCSTGGLPCGDQGDVVKLVVERPQLVQGVDGTLPSS